MNANVGRWLWTSIHVYAAIRSKVGLDQQKFFITWLKGVKDSIECESCYKKLVWFMGKWPVDYGEGFYLWSICLHDYVNKEMGKPLFFPHLTLEPLKQRGIIQ